MSLKGGRVFSFYTSLPEKWNMSEISLGLLTPTLWLEECVIWK